MLVNNYELFSTVEMNPVRVLENLSLSSEVFCVYDSPHLSKFNQMEL